MASATPVVCSDRGSLKEVVGDAALIVDPEKPEAIAEGITKVIGDKQLGESLTTRGLARATQFTWERAAERTYRVYQEVAG
jgi:glycosyltransferase involved in cell wall biosynthesis